MSQQKTHPGSADRRLKIVEVKLVTKGLPPGFEVAEGSREVVARISTTAVDRDGDVVLPSGADLRNFKLNPVVLFVHENRKLPVGKMIRIRKERDAILVKYRFAARPDSLPATEEWLPDTLLDLMQQGVLSAHSIGFLIKQGGLREADEKDKKRFGEDAQFIITDWELLEFSIVPVPANQEALAQAVSKGLDIDYAKTLGFEELKREPVSLRTLDLKVVAA